MADNSLRPIYPDPQEPTAAPMRRSAEVVRLPMTFEMRVRQMVIFEALRTARQIVKDRLKAQGVKVSLVAANKITELALAHLRANATELLAQAEASGAVQKLRVAHGQRPVDPQAKSLCECQAQNER
jgi:hypothetical protein